MNTRSCLLFVANREENHDTCHRRTLELFAVAILRNQEAFCGRHLGSVIRIYSYVYAGLLEKYSAQQRLSGAEPAMLYLGLHMFRTTALPLMWRDFVPLEYSFVPVEGLCPS